MQNQNEHRIFLTVSNQHPDSYSHNPNSNQISKVESDIPNMVVSEGEEGQNLSSGFRADNISNLQNSKVNLTEGRVNNISHQIISEEENGYTFSFMEDKLKRNPEEMIDQITFSDDEEDPVKIPRMKEVISAEMHDNESRVIYDLYEEDASMTKYTGTKNELDKRKEIPIPLALTPSDVLIEAGMIDDLIDDRIIIKANSFNGILDLDNIIFTINKIAFGYIDDVIGKIDQPVYIVRNFPNVNISSLNLNHGQSIYNVKDKSKYVGQKQLLRKGCDASNAFDEEVSDDEMEFSDDEEEMTRRSEIRKRKKSTNSNKNDSHKKRKLDEENFALCDNNALSNSMMKLKEQYAFNNRNIGNNLSNNQIMYENKINAQTGTNTSNMYSKNNNNPSNPFYSNEYKMPSHNISSTMNTQINQANSYQMNNFAYPGSNLNSFNPYAQMNPMNPMSMYSQPFNQMNHISHLNTQFPNTNQQSFNGININFQSVNPFQPPNSQNNFK